MRAALALVSISIAGCLGAPTPSEEEAEAIGHEDSGPEHNPGQPCVLCHGDDMFAGGTIFLDPTDPDTRGLDGVRVTITDAQGRSADAITNRAGNFYFSRGGFEDAAWLSFDPVFPLRVRVEQGDLAQEMITGIQRERSCSACHRGQPGTDSIGRVYLRDPP